MPKYFIIKTGFGAEDFIPITHNELDKAIYCQIMGIVGVFDGGTINGKNIISIKEDWHRQLGLNRGYKLQSEDFAIISSDSACNSYKGQMEASKQRVNHLMSTGRTDLIGKAEAKKLL